MRPVRRSVMDNYNEYPNDRNTEYYNYDMDTMQRGYGGYAAPALSLSSYIARTYGWMALGLLVTFAVALGAYISGAVVNIFMTGGRFALILITIAELGVVVFLSARIHKMSVGMARTLFLVYAALTGLTFSMYFLLFDLTILIYAFGATAVLFGGMAAASLIFRMELDSIRPLLFGGLIMLIIVGVLGMFLNLGAFNIMICYLGIAIFLGYTAYDTAKIRQNYEYYSRMGDSVVLEKASIFSALQLYLDFVNLFLYILRLLSNSRGSRK